MSALKSTLAQAQDRCEKRGARFTAKRSQALSVLIQADKALSAYEVADAFNKAHNEKITAVSMYRILDFLVSENLVHRLDLANKYIACEHISCEHSHPHSQFLICTQCQKVKEVQMSQTVTTEVYHNIHAAGFTPSNQQLEISCICNDCQPPH